MEQEIGCTSSVESKSVLDSDEQIYLEYYRIWIGTISASEARRQAASAFYISIIVALTGIFSLSDGSEAGYLLLSVWLVSLLWFFTIRYFRGIAKAKFDVIDLLEQKLRMPMYKIEWEIFKSKYKGHFKSLEVTNIEILLPIVAWAVSSAALIVVIVNFYRPG